ncbi:MAG TPA: M23 family metallopeptidase [Pantanalinema sp.]
MPFHSGVVVLCQQGNKSPSGQTHSYPNALHAVDFSNVSADAQEIVAAAEGTILETFTDARKGDLQAGDGWGNYVKIGHGHGYYTVYAHLDRVRVNPGARVRQGDAIGRMGDTGAAGNPHLHFSLHHDSHPGPGVGRSVPFRILTADLNQSNAFSAMASEKIMGHGRGYSIDAGHLYASENDGGPTKSGVPEEALGKRIKQSHQGLLSSLSKP